MEIVEIFAIAVGLAMDAFAVSVCKGLSIKEIDWKKSYIIATYFGGFQAIMPYFGFLLGISVEEYITRIDHWIAFVLLSFIGINMIKESFNENNINSSIDIKTMVLLSLATSIDAMAVGITFAFLNVNIYIAISIIGIVTFIISLLGILIGNKFGNKYERKAEIAGGIILISIGLKILIEHLGIL